jgi:flavin reductase (DIM6/NTAB) family NADH-FMN oxidoreductase RutF
MTALRAAPTEAAGTPDLRNQFRLAMRRQAATVHVVTALHGGRRQGMTATAVCSLSFDPLSLLVCVNESATIYLALRAADRFCVNVLAAGQGDIATQFGSSALAPRRFSLGTWIDVDGAPVLAEAQSSIVCRRETLGQVGTHGIIVGHVLSVRTQDVAPLVYRDGGYVT